MKKSKTRYLVFLKRLLGTHFFKVMRLTIFLILVGISNVFATSTYSQSTKFSFHLRNISLEQLFGEIQNQSEFNIFYKDSQVDLNRKISVKADNAAVEDILEQALEGTHLEYKVIDKQIVIFPARSKHTDDMKSQGEIITVQSQQKLISGKVTDESGQPLPGVTVVVKGTTQGTITNADGEYSLSNIPADATLQFSFVGMRAQEKPVAGQSSINITLEEETVGIEEVVAIGYGVMKKSNVSGSITSVNSEDLHTTSTNDAGQALQGKAPIYISQSSGAPGSETSVFIRGVGTLRDASPIWVIDGVKGAPLDNFNNVESIQVLKDAASTAIYGIEGANGVILVTTNKASKGKISVNYNGYVKINKALNLPDMLGTKDYANMFINRYVSENPTLDYTEYVKSFYLQTDAEFAEYPNTDWVDVMFGTGLEQVHSISVSGGNDNSNYFLSVLHEGDEGTLVNTNYSKNAIKLKVDQQITPWLKFEETINYYSDKERPTQSSYRSDKFWQNTFRGNPAMKVYDSTNPMGTGYGYFSDEFLETIEWQGTNPLEEKEMIDYWIKSENIWGNFQVTLNPIKNLTWTTNVTGKIYNSRSSLFRYDIYGGCSNNSLEFTKILNAYNQFEYDNSTTKQYLISSVINYNWSIKKNNIGITAGTEIWESSIYGAKGDVAYGIPSEEFRTSELADDTYVAGDNYFSDDSGYSQFGRLTYSYDSRYLMTASFRNDASSNFAPGKRMAFFPALSLGWNLANENFFNLDKISQLKLRYGIGESGNDDVPANLWRQTYTSTGTSYEASKVVNKDITWEKTITNNIGIDVGFLKNSLTASVDVYDKKTHDALLKIALPSSSGFSSYYINKGKVQNRGIELSLSYRKTINDFNLSANGNVAYNKNKVLNLGDATYLSGGDNNRTYENGPVSAFYGYVADGLYQSQEEIDELNAKAVENGYDSYDGDIAPGDIKFKDIDGDSTITSDGDQQSIGDPWPKYIFGFNFNCKYKNIDFSMSWQGVAGIDIFNGILEYTDNMFSDYNSTPRVFDAWSETNTNTSIPRLGNSDHNYNSSSYLVEDGSYLKLRNIQVGYDLGSQFPNIKFTKLRVYLAIENALTFTKFRGFDPEFMSGDDNYARGVYELDQYPQSGAVIFGIQVGL